jgi:hypothetical protein
MQLSSFTGAADGLCTKTSTQRGHQEKLTQRRKGAKEQMLSPCKAPQHNLLQRERWRSNNLRSVRLFFGGAFISPFHAYPR